MTVTSALTTSRRRSRSRSNPRTATPVTLRLILLLVLLASLALLFCGSRLLLAGIASYQTQAFLDDWMRKGEEPNPRAWQIAHDAAQRAIALYPGSNGEYLERLGRVLQWKQFRHPLGADTAEQSRREALQAFRAASEARPTWPNNWVALAYAKLYLLEFDNEFGRALQQAQALGPNRIEINRTLAEIGFIAWAQLNDEQRRATLESARRTVKHGPKETKNLLVIASQTGMSSELCDSLDAELKDTRKICR